MMTLDTKMFASLIGITEGELVHALKGNNLIKGRELPKPISKSKGRTRRFSYDEAKAFANALNKNVR